MTGSLADFPLEEIHEPGSHEAVALVQCVADDGTVFLHYADGRRGRAQVNGTPLPGLRHFLEYLFASVDEVFGAPYVVIQTTRDDRCVAWYPDEDGALHRLRDACLATSLVAAETL